MPLPKPTPLRPLIRSISTHKMPPPTPALRILPLGGSITHGTASSHHSGYRLSLAQRLHHANHVARFVGSRTSGAGPHEGWRGARVDQITTRATRSIARFKPNLVLLNAGSNDCLQDFAMEQFGERVEALLDVIWRRSERVTVLVSTLVPSADGAVEERVRGANGVIRELVEWQQEEGRRVMLVDMHGGDGAVRVEDLSVDGTHPNDRGYEKMAALWFRGVEEAVGKGMVQEAEEMEDDAKGLVMVE